MKTNKSFGMLHTMLGAIALTVAASSALAEASLEYKLTLAEDGQTYQVWMKPSSTPKPDISLTGQVTIKAPHAAEFKVTNLKSTIEGSNWVEASRVDSPAEATGSDYISFSFVGLQGTSARNYAWSEDREQIVFSFENENGCIDDVSLMADDDAFNVLPNSANTNPGNQFTNLGWGAVSENHYKGTYGDAISCKK